MANAKMFTTHHAAAAEAHGKGDHKTARHHVGKMLHALNDRTAPEQEGGEAIHLPTMKEPAGLRAKLAAMRKL